MRFVSVLTILSAGVLSLGPTAPAALAQPANAEAPIIIGVEDLDYAPHYTTLSGSFRGFGRDLLDMFAAVEKLSFEYRPMPVLRLHQALIEGRVGFKYPDNPAWQGDLKQSVGVAYSKPIVSYTDGVLVSPARLTQPAEPLRVALVRGFTLPPQLGVPALSEQNTMAAAVREVLLGHADGVFGNVGVVQHQMHQVMLLPPGTLVLDRRLPFDRGHYHLSSRDQKALLARFDHWLEHEAAWVSALKQRYGLE